MPLRRLERSIALNDNRQTYRSRLLLDEDRAVRRADLAAIYDFAGSRELAFREASRAVRDDPANFSSHLFLANAYDQLRDPLRINLRYETPWSGSLLQARLLAPATAGAVTPTVGLGEYTRLFEPPHFTFQGEATWLDTGEKRHTVAHAGNLGRTNYCAGVPLPAVSRRAHESRFCPKRIHRRGSPPAFPRTTRCWRKPPFKRSTAATCEPGIPPGTESVSSRFREKQLPLISVGYRHRWRPGSDTLLLAARLETDFRKEDPRAEHPIFVRETDGRLTFIPPPLPFASHLRQSFRAVSRRILPPRTVQTDFAASGRSFSAWHVFR